MRPRGWLLAVLVCLPAAATALPAAGAAAGMVPAIAGPAAGTVPAIAGPAAAGPPAEWVGGVPAVAGTAPAAAGDNETNGTVRHSDPDERRESGDLAAVRGWLGGRMDQVIVDCTEGVEVGNYDACERLDGDYPDWVGQYVEVTRRTGADNGTAEAYEEAGERQREYAETVRTYRETLREYRRARENGNTERARQLARELVRLERRADRTGTDLVDDYDTITESGQANLTGSRETVEEINRNISETTERIEREEFVRTEVTATAADDDVSFADPLVVRGRVTTENGTALANETVVIVAGNRSTGSAANRSTGTANRSAGTDNRSVVNRTVRTRTDEDGEYELVYRPATVPVGENAFTVRFAPRVASPFLGANATVNATVEQVDPSVRVERSPGSAGFGDNVTVSGSVSADGAGADGVPVVVTVGGERVGRATTDDDGEFDLTRPLPAAVPPGRQAVRATVPLRDRALANASATARAPLAVTTTGTDLAVSGDHANGTVVVRGRLTTVGGDPVGGEAVVVSLGGTQVDVVRTGEDGRFATRVAVPEDHRPGAGERDALAVEAVYTGQRRNLDGAVGQVQVVLRGPPDGPTGSLDGLATFAERRPGVALALAGLLLVVLAGGTVLARRRVGAASPSPASGAAAVGEQTPEEQAGDESRVRGLLAQAREGLSDGRPGDAVTAAYVAARTRLGDAGTRAHTHWEFYNDRREGLDRRRARALERLTELYERAAFGNEAPSYGTARDALAMAETIAAEDESPSVSPDGGRGLDDASSGAGDDPEP